MHWLFIPFALAEMTVQMFTPRNHRGPYEPPRQGNPHFVPPRPPLPAGDMFYGVPVTREAWRDYESAVEREIERPV